MNMPLSYFYLVLMLQDDASGVELYLHLKALSVEKDRKGARVFTSQKTYCISYSDQKTEHIRRK